MRCTRPAAKIDQAARHARGFRRFDADLAGECGHLLINQEILSNSPFGRTTQTVVAFQRQHKGPSARVLIFKKTAEPARQAHTAYMPSCRCVRLPRLLLRQPRGPDNAAQPSKRPQRLYGRLGRGAASAIKSRLEPRIVVCRKHSASPSRAKLQS